MKNFGSATVRVSLSVFEGPLDLLLYLVKNDEVDIYDIQISRITEQYIKFLNQMEAMNLEVAGEFLVMAANLLYIKSRTLLPVSQQPPEEDTEEDDPRWDLIRQLVEYKKFKEAANQLHIREGEQRQIFYRADQPLLVVEQKPNLGKVSMFDLVQTFQKILARFDENQKKNGVREIFEEHFTVGQKIEYILDKLSVGSASLFTELFQELASRHEIVVTFLAMLELIRLKQLRVKQSSGQFGEIEIERVG